MPTTKEKILNYVMESPYNSNRAVLDGLLEDYKNNEDKPVDTEGKSLILIDYDGTPLYSYTKEEALALTSLPTTAGDHDFLIFEEWNWSLSKIKSYISNYDPKLIVGAEYSSEDDATIIYFQILEGGNKSRTVFFNLNEGRITIDWGDGSVISDFDPSDYSYTLTHNYSNYGTFAVKIFTTQGTLNLGGLNDADKYTVPLLVIGKNCSLPQEFLPVLTLKNVVLTKGLSTFTHIRTFWDSGIEAVVVPKGFSDNASWSGFTDCRWIKTISLSESSGDQIKGFSSFTSIETISIPEGNTKTWYFQGCTLLKNVIIPEGVTQIIGTSFSKCYSLTKLIFPSSITSIGGSAFEYCYSLHTLDFSKLSSVPKLSSSGLGYLPGDYIILLKDQSMYDSFSADTNWSAYISHFQIKGATQ